MPLVFSPLSESVLDSPPKSLLPRHAFVMRQLGDPPAIDIEICVKLKQIFANRNFLIIDADGTTGSKDYLERILGLIRCTGFTVAIFTEETRPNSMANIALELGFAAMCGKPIVIAKSKGAVAPSDLKRTDWIDYDSSDTSSFDRKINQALDEIEKLGLLEETLLSVAIDARSTDCAIALERSIKGFLISGDQIFISNARKLLDIVNSVKEGETIADLERIRSDIKVFIHQANVIL